MEGKRIKVIEGRSVKCCRMARGRKPQRYDPSHQRVVGVGCDRCFRGIVLFWRSFADARRADAGGAALVCLWPGDQLLARYRRQLAGVFGSRMDRVPQAARVESIVALAIGERSPSL